MQVERRLFDSPAVQRRPATSLEVSHFVEAAATVMGDRETSHLARSIVATEVIELAEELYRAACRKGTFVYDRRLEGEQE